VRTSIHYECRWVSIWHFKDYVWNAANRPQREQSREAANQRAHEDKHTDTKRNARHKQRRLPRMGE
jgi:hypothetical protein